MKPGLDFAQNTIKDDYWARASPLPYSFYRRDTTTVAQELLGKAMVHFSAEGITAGLVVETEAYLGPHDPACHSARGRTERNAVMFGPAGHAYIYLIYGMHLCFNVTTDRDGLAAAVLVRALEPLTGIELMARRRRCPAPRDLCRGPARLVQAMGITIALNGASVVEGPVRFYDIGYEVHPNRVRRAPRVGISRATDWPLRFYLAGSAYVSHK